MKDTRSLFQRIGGTRAVMAGAGIALVAGIVIWNNGDKAKPAADKPGRGGGGVAVETAAASRADVPVYLEGLGTVQAFNTVTISSRVDGALQKVGFVEGQQVKKGDLLAQIDPRPYQAAFDQAKATKAKDSALLANAKRDLDRYASLAPDNLASQQTVDTQRALVAQLEAQVAGDQAQIDNARTLLDYSTITSPIDGRTGVRLIDPGNNVHATDTKGIVVVTQTQPISVLFTLPEEDLDQVTAALAKGEVEVAAMARDGQSELDRGKIQVLDNLVDQSTGTIHIKATFPNANNRLWPGAYVTARVLLETRKNVVTVPVAALQRGPNGMYAYVVKNDQTVEMRPLKVTNENGPVVMVDAGLNEGERVTITNEYRLQNGAPIRVVSAGNGGGNTAKAAE